MNREGRVRAVVWMLLALGASCALAVAFTLTPDARGFGSHEQLGLAPCGFHAWTGWPCPGCGLTTSVVHAAHGQLRLAFAAHLSGPPLFLAFVLIALLGPVLALKRGTLRTLVDSRLARALITSMAVGVAVTIALRWLGDQ